MGELAVINEAINYIMENYRDKEIYVMTNSMSSLQNIRTFKDDRKFISEFREKIIYHEKIVEMDESSNF